MIKNLIVNERSLYELFINQASRRTLSERAIDKATTAFISTEYPESGKPLSYISSGLKNTVNGFTFLTCGLFSVVTEDLYNKKRKKEIVKASNYTSEEIAIDINEFLEATNSDEKEDMPVIKCFGDEIRYSALTCKNGFENIETIFGDAHFEALDDVSCLANLKYVLGSIYFSRCQELDGFGIEVVGGDIHAEKLLTSAGFENLKFVGGRIYYQDGEYDLKTFKNDVLGIFVKTK